MSTIATLAAHTLPDTPKLVMDGVSSAQISHEKVSPAPCTSVQHAFFSEASRSGPTVLIYDNRRRPSFTALLGSSIDGATKMWP